MNSRVDIGESIMGYAIGESMIRLEDEPLLRGLGQFIDDINPGPDTLHVSFLRSPYPHANINSIETIAAKALDGVEEIFVGEDFRSVISPISADYDHPGFAVTVRSALPIDRVRFVGDTMAMVLAIDPYVALDALELIKIDLTPLPAVSDVDSALADKAPRVHEGIADNVVFHSQFESEGFDAAHAASPLKLCESFSTARLAAVSMEPRGCIAVFDVTTQMLTFWSSTQVPHLVRSAIAEYLGLGEDHVRVIVPDVGGGFGMKTVVYPEELLIAAAAIKTSRPIKWIQDRYDDFLTSAHARDHCYDMEIGFDHNGILLSLRAEMFVNIGAYASLPFGSSLEANGGPRNLPGPYKLRNFSYRTRSILTNTCPTGAYRGVSAPVSCMTIEVMLDRIARQVGLDPAEVRRRNLVNLFPYKNVLGLEYSEGCFLPMLERTLQIANYQSLREKQKNQTVNSNLRLGIGVSVTTEQTGMGSSRYKARGLHRIPGFESVKVQLAHDGSVEVYISQASQGQGHITAFTQIVATELGVPVEIVRVVEGDTSYPVEGSGTFASRGMAIAGNAAVDASRQLRLRILERASALLGYDSASCEIAGKVVQVTNKVSRNISLKDLARSITDPSDFMVTVQSDPPSIVLAATVHVVCVNVDVSSGEVMILSYAIVHDCGRMINPMMVDGQVMGAAVQGIGEVLMEGLRYDADAQPLTISLMEYEIPRSVDIVPFLIESMHSEEGKHHFKGVGESGTIGAVPAVTSAIQDALFGLNVSVNTLPLTSKRIRTMLMKASI